MRREVKNLVTVPSAAFIRIVIDRIGLTRPGTAIPSTRIGHTVQITVFELAEIFLAILIKIPPPVR